MFVFTKNYEHRVIFVLLIRKKIRCDEPKWCINDLGHVLRNHKRKRQSFLERNRTTHIHIMHQNESYN